ncbi:MAG: PAS domain-containing protein [Desulforhopalus sp.]
MNRIAHKLVLWLIFFGIILVILGTATELFFDYHDDLERVHALQSDVAQSRIPEIEESLRTRDSKALDISLDNLLISGDLVYVAVIVEGRLHLHRGEKPQSRTAVATYPLVTVSDDQEVSKTAFLEVVTDMGPIWRKHRIRYVQLFLGNTLKLFLIAGFVLLMFQYLVTRHLESLARQVRSLDFTTAYSPLRLERKNSENQDELEQVVSGLNSMYKRAQEAYESLEKNGQRLLLFFDSTEETIIGVNRQGVCSFANDACLQLLGLKSYDEIINKRLHDLFVHSNGKKNGDLTGECLVFQSMDEATALQCEDGTVTMVSGEVLLVAVRCYPVFKNEEVSGAVIFMTDNRETRQLRRERELLSEAVKQVPVMIIIADKENRIEFVNPSAERLTGFDREELLGRSVLSFQEMLIDGAATYGKIKSALKSGRQWVGVIEGRTKRGVAVQLYSIISPVFDARGKISNYISVSREISYEVALQNELVNVKKMEAVGRLSANFAHEFGNPLFGVRSVLKDFSNRDYFSSEDARLINLAYSECERMRAMVREFHQLYQDSGDGESLNKLQDIIAKIIHETSQRAQAASIVCDFDISAENRSIAVNRNKLFLVLKNIIINAMESMAETGGRLQISDRKERDSLIVSICDEGKGIAIQHQELIFEPFFSTKPEIEGAGLGLSVAYGTMKSIGGSITFSSQPDQGALFEVHIPIW